MSFRKSMITQIAENIMNTAVENLLTNKNLIPCHFILSPDGLATFPMVDEKLTPRMAHPMICKVAKELNADAILFVMEAWMIDAQKKDPGKAVSEHGDCGEVVMVVVATRQDESALISPFTRPAEGIIDVAEPFWSPSELPLFQPFWSQNENH